MSPMSSGIRLYVNSPLREGQIVALEPSQAHYLFGVMRQQSGSTLLLFNGRDGEWHASVTRVGRQRGTLEVLERTRPLQLPPDLWLLFAPVKKTRTDFIVEKAAEMGAARIIPVQTQCTNSGRVRCERLRSHAVEAAQQCGGTYVPEVSDMRPLAHMLAEWPDGRKLMFCDETTAGANRPNIPDGGGKWAILIGPEGGFTETERRQLHALPFVHAVSLGPRILRSDTAAVAAMTLWQEHLGDWS